MTALFSHVEHQQAIRVPIGRVPLHEAGPWSVWLDDEDDDPDGEWERDGGWER